MKRVLFLSLIGMLIFILTSLCVYALVCVPKADSLASQGDCDNCAVPAGCTSVGTTCQGGTGGGGAGSMCRSCQTAEKKSIEPILLLMSLGLFLIKPRKNIA
jgi:hypothetical protein